MNIVKQLKSLEKSLKELIPIVNRFHIQASSKVEEADNAERVIKKLREEKKSLDVQISKGRSIAEQEIKAKFNEALKKEADISKREEALVKKEKHIGELETNLARKTKEYEELIKAEVKASMPKPKAEAKPKAKEDK